MPARPATSTKYRWPRQVPPPLPAWNGLLASVAANAFDALGVSVALWVTGSHWFPIHVTQTMSRFEFEHGIGIRRWNYNERCFARAKRTKRPVLGEHAGFRDLFLPLFDASGLRGILVTGPFALARPTSAEVADRWRFLTGKQARVSEPRFAEYLAETLSALTLEGSAFATFQRMMTCLAGLVQDRENPEARAAEFQRLRNDLHPLLLPQRMARAVRNMVDDRISATYLKSDEAELHDMGMAALPEHGVVGLFRTRDDEPDRIDDLIRRNSFQRASAELATRIGGVASGPVGDHGVAFLVEHTGPRAATRAALHDLAIRATNLARRHGLRLHLGICSGDARKLPLPNTYRAALWAAERSLVQGLGITQAEARREGSGAILRQMRAELAESLREQPAVLLARFDRYVEAVLAHAGYSLELTRAPLEAGLERLTAPLLAGGFLDRRSCDELFVAIEQNAQRARTVRELVDSYRRLIVGIENAMKDPTLARQDRGTQRAVAFLREHFAEPISVEQVARIAGFAPDHFTRLFKRDEGMTPESYLRSLRIDHAKTTLLGTKLNMESVRKLCGFRTRNYFHRAFKQAVGLTPVQYREASV
jgi:AraC-like DNA-binding protein